MIHCKSPLSPSPLASIWPMAITESPNCRIVACINIRRIHFGETNLALRRHWAAPGALTVPTHTHTSHTPPQRITPWPHSCTLSMPTNHNQIHLAEIGEQEPKTFPTPSQRKSKNKWKERQERTREINNSPFRSHTAKMCRNNYTGLMCAVTRKVSPSFGYNIHDRRRQHRATHCARFPSSTFLPFQCGPPVSPPTHRHPHLPHNTHTPNKSSSKNTFEYNSLIKLHSCKLISMTFTLF